MMQKDTLFNGLPPLLTITEAAELLRVTPLTLKRWEKKGKIVPLRINSRGDRRYTQDQIATALGIQTQIETNSEPFSFNHSEENSDPIII